jgi:hypothetical protein
MKTILAAITAILFLSGHGLAAVSILIEPTLSGGTLFTITQTEANPALAVSGLSGYALGMDLPLAMFDIPGGGSGVSGTFPASLGTVTETVTGQTFQLTGLQIGSGETYALLLFNPIYLTSGQSSAQFSVSQPTPVETSISPLALVPGTHSTSSVLFGTVTVTVVPEPSVLAFLPGMALPLLKRRRSPRPSAP